MKQRSIIVHLSIIAIIMVSCKTNFTPKPKGYFRIDLPEKQYQVVCPEACPYKFEMPVYATLQPYDANNAHTCWYNVGFTSYGATLHLTYKPIQSNLSGFIEDVRAMAYKHTVKADDIEETFMQNDTNGSFGVLYDIKGNAASSVNFFVTDSTHHFISGSLYFNTKPNIDSLRPVVQFFRKDIIHLMQTITWEY